MIYDVTDLDVYNRAVKALHLVYKLEKQIPNSHFKLRTQLTSAAEGIPARIDRVLCQEVIVEYKIISKQINNLRNKWVDYSKK